MILLIIPYLALVTFGIIGIFAAKETYIRMFEKYRAKMLLDCIKMVFFPISLLVSFVRDALSYIRINKKKHDRSQVNGWVR